MIRVDQPKTIPAILRVRGAKARTALCAAFERGERSFKFDSKLYGAASVKGTLAASQHRKCSYCEALFLHSSYGDIDHYRPKASINQGGRGPEIVPGYYWLAYDIENLLLTCERCNRSHKRTFFPLANPAERARSHHESLAREVPLIINPRLEDPKKHIRFREEYPFPLTASGKATIKYVGLDREPLNEARRDHLRRIWALWQLNRMGGPEAAAASQSLDKLCLTKSPFCSATSDYRDHLDSTTKPRS